MTHPANDAGSTDALITFGLRSKTATVGVGWDGARALPYAGYGAAGLGLLNGIYSAVTAKDDDGTHAGVGGTLLAGAGGALKGMALGGVLGAGIGGTSVSGLPLTNRTLGMPELSGYADTRRELDLLERGPAPGDRSYTYASGKRRAATMAADRGPAPGDRSYTYASGKRRAAMKASRKGRGDK